MREFEIRWRNFRSLEDTGWLQIKPLTVVIGANASGKTSLVAPLLILKQTLNSVQPAVALKTQGSLFNAGDFQNLIFAHHTDRELGLSIRFHHHELSEDGSPKNPEPPGHYPPGALDLGFVAAGDDGSAAFKSFIVRDVYGRPMLRRTRSVRGSYSLVGAVAPKTESDFLKAAIQAKPEHFLFTPNGVFKEMARRRRQKQAHTEAAHEPAAFELDEEAEEYLATLSYTQQPISSLLADLAYIGPLRERPRRLYETTGERPSDVGVRGENAPEIIFRQGDGSTLGLINQWIRRFEFGPGLACRKLCDGAFGLTLKQTRSTPEVNCADTGFGLSQILPLIVQGAYATEGSLLIAEQPEIHLNPRCQTTLADLFVDMTNRGQGVLLETHSEHLLLRLRRLIAEKSINANDVAIYFVEKKQQTSKIRRVPVDSKGHIEGKDWPSEFFGESLSEALALAEAQLK